VVESNYRLARGSRERRAENFWELVPEGFLMLSCRKTKQGQVRERWLQLREMPVELTTGGSEVVHNDGRNARAAS